MRRKAPAVGTKRHRRRFLWFPKTIQHETRWLEVAAWVEIVAHSHKSWWWFPMRWDDEGGKGA